MAFLLAAAETFVDGQCSLDALCQIDGTLTSSILRHFGEEFMAAPNDFPEDLRAKERRHIAKILMWKFVARENPSNSTPSLTKRRLASARTEALGFWARLGPPWDAYGRLRSGKPISKATLRQLLGKSDILTTLLVQPGPTNTSIALLSHEGQIVHSVALAPNRDQMRLLVLKALRECQRNNNATEMLDEFSKLLRPIIQHVPCGSVLRIIAAGPAIQMPFAAFKFDGQYFVERNATALLPSISLLAYRESTDPKVFLQSAIVLGDLPFARIEAMKVAQQFGVQRLIGVDAARHYITLFLSRYSDIMHIACHGKFEPRQPERSGILLSDGSLSARDANALKMRVKLAVLTACESGRLIVTESGHGVGISAAFMLAGAERVISAFWRVDDRASAELILRFYQLALTGQPLGLAEALQKAQLHILSQPEFRAPYFWAGLRPTFRPQVPIGAKSLSGAAPALHRIKPVFSRGAMFRVKSNSKKHLKMHSEGLEPPTLGSEDRCSIQLSYECSLSNALGNLYFNSAICIKSIARS
jgi:CHAT domain-containing protein